MFDFNKLKLILTGQFIKFCISSVLVSWYDIDIKSQCKAINGQNRVGNFWANYRILRLDPSQITSFDIGWDTD